MQSARLAFEAKCALPLRAWRSQRERLDPFALEARGAAAPPDRSTRVRRTRSARVGHDAVPASPFTPLHMRRRP